jgi:hypothetical protein
MGRLINLEDVKASMVQTDDDRVRLEFGSFDIQIVHTDEGVVVDIYSKLKNEGPFVESLASTYAYDAETADATFGELRRWCDDHGVRIVQAEEIEVRGMWDWLDESGNACDYSFPTEREAMQNAYDVFNS